MELVDLGKSRLDSGQAAGILDPFFEEGTYDVLRKNCNSFSDAAAWLLSKSRLDAKFNRLERWVVNLEPMSLELIRRMKELGLHWDPRLMSMLQQSDQEAPPGYVPNPRAKDFNVEQVVSRLGSRTTPRATRHHHCCNRNSPLPLPASLKKMCHSSEEVSPLSHDGANLKDTVIEMSWEPSVEDYPCRPWNPFERTKENLTCDEPEPKVPAVIIERLRLPGGIGGPIPPRVCSRTEAASIHEVMEEDVVWRSN